MDGRPRAREAVVGGERARRPRRRHAARRPVRPAGAAARPADDPVLHPGRHRLRAADARRGHPRGPARDRAAGDARARSAAVPPRDRAVDQRAAQRRPPAAAGGRLLHRPELRRRARARLGARLGHARDVHRVLSRAAAADLRRVGFGGRRDPLGHDRVRVPARAVRARPLGRAGRAPADRQRRCGALDHPGDGLRRLRRRLRPLRGSVRRGRRAAGRHGRGGDGDRAARGAAAGAAARRLRRDLLLLVRPDDRAERHGGDRARRDRRGRP